MAATEEPRVWPQMDVLQPTPSELEAIAGSAQIASKVAAAMNNAATAAYQRATVRRRRDAIETPVPRRSP